MKTYMLLLIALLLAVSSVAHAQDDPLPIIDAQTVPPLPADATSVRVSADVDLLLRASPNREADQLAVIPFGTVLPAVGRAPDWLQVVYEGQTGWVARWLLTWEGDPFTLPRTTVPTVVSSTDAYAVTQDFVNLRRGPGRAWEVLTVLPPGLQVAAVGRSGYWLQVVHDGQYGWVYFEYVVGSGRVDEMPIDGVNPEPFVRMAGAQDNDFSFRGPSISVLFRESYADAYTQADNAYNTMSGFWRTVADGGSVACEHVPAPVPGDIVLSEEEIRAFSTDLAVQYDAARTTLTLAAGQINQTIALAQTICARPDAPFATRGQVIGALNTLEDAGATLAILRGILF